METFWNTIAQYNESTWWAQILITAAGILLTALLYRRPTVWTKRSMKIYMVFLNGWIALVYYAMYCDTRNYHYVLSLRILGNRRIDLAVGFIYRLHSVRA